MAAVFSWASRRAGGLAMISTSVLAYWVIHQQRKSEHSSNKHQHDVAYLSNVIVPISTAQDQTNFWMVIFAYYMLAIHIMVFCFPIRACWAVYDLTSSLRRAARRKNMKELRFSHRRRGSTTSLSSATTLTSSVEVESSSSSEAGESEFLFDPLDRDEESGRVVHAIIIPSYMEDMDTLRETLEVLSSHPQAREQYDVYLAMEQREHNVELKATSLVSEFIRNFRSLDFTIHPASIPGELAGKGSNTAWCARLLSERYSLTARRDVVVTLIDADSHLSSSYFSLLTSMSIAFPTTANTTLYAAPIIFDRNADKVPAIVRVADIMWSAAGMSGLYSTSTISPPTSVYSLPLVLVDRVGGWDCDNEAIGEDLHMYLKCFFVLNGNLTVQTILSPVSQTNVTGGGHQLRWKGGLSDVRARYKQALRHMWGALDTGFALRKLVELWRERKHTSRAFRPLHTSLEKASHMYVPDRQPDGDAVKFVAESGIFADVTHDTVKNINYIRLVSLFHRLFEAHFLPLQMTITIISSALYLLLTEGVPTGYGIPYVFAVCGWLRTIGFLEVALYLILYERFHAICVAAREEEMKEAGLSEGMHFSRRSRKANCIDYFMVPLVAPLFGSIPCAQAQICHFWTLDLVYSVSKKVTRLRTKSIEGVMAAARHMV